MTSEAIMTVSATVVVLTQLAKWSGVPDRFGPLAVIVLSAVGVGLWAYSQGWKPEDLQALVWPLFAGWVAVATGAAGTFGFTRAAASAVVSAMPPPKEGAGSSRTTS